jgi:hypothetical protein
MYGLSENVHTLYRNKDSILVTKRETQRKIGTVYIYVPSQGCGI